MTGVLPTAVYDAGWLFVAYGVLGVVVEVVYCLFVQRPGVLESRSGVLYLPFNPLYAAAGTLGSFLLAPLAANPLAVFIVGAVVFTAVEYVASLVLERGLHVVAWDYRAEPFNLAGRVCLRNALYWGGLAVVLAYVADPGIRSMLALVSRPVGEAALVITLALVTLDITLTALALIRAARVSAATRPRRMFQVAPGDSSGWRLVGRLVPDRALIDTFPHVALVREYGRLRGVVPRQIRLWGERRVESARS